VKEQADDGVVFRRVSWRRDRSGEWQPEELVKLDTAEVEAVLSILNGQRFESPTAFLQATKDRIDAVVSAKPLLNDVRIETDAPS
jgi:hypothetical protein